PLVGHLIAWKLHAGPVSAADHGVAHVAHGHVLELPVEQLAEERLRLADVVRHQLAVHERITHGASPFAGLHDARRRSARRSAAPPTQPPCKMKPPDRWQRSGGLFSYATAPAPRPLPGSDEPGGGLDSCMAHVLVGEPVSTSPGHALPLRALEQRRDAAGGDAAVAALRSVGRDLQVLLAVAL